jgi:CHAT domain-containing protein/Flp pilus assembly protein TadD
VASAVVNPKKRVPTQQPLGAEAGIRQLIEKLLQALKDHDFDTYIALWSGNSPAYSQQKALKTRIKSENFDFSNPQFSRFSLSGDKATTRVAVDSRTSADISQAIAVRRLFYNFTFINEAGSWKIWGRSDAQSDFATALTRAETQTQVNSLLREESEMVDIYLFQELVSQGKAVFFNDPTQARKSFQLAYDVAVLIDQRGSSPLSQNAIGTSLHSLANTERAQGNYGKVLAYEERALAFATAPKLKTDVFINLGITHALQNEYDLAFQFLNNALTTAQAVQEETDRTPRLGLIYDSLGNLRSVQERFDDAVNYYNLSLTYRTDPNDRSQSFDNIGIIYYKKRDFEGAVKQFNESLRLIEGKNLLLTATVLNNLADAAFAQGDASGAIEYAKRAAALADQINMPELQWRAYLIEAKARRSQRDISKAKTLLDDSIKVIEGMRGRAGGGVAGRQRFLEDKLEPYNVMIDLLITEGRSAEAFDYSERSKANSLLEVLSSGLIFLQRMMNGDEQHQEQLFLAELANLNATILKIQLQDSARGSELSELIERRNSVTGKYEAFLDGLYYKYLRLKAKNGTILTIKLDETAELLRDEKTAILEFSVGDNATYLYVITKKVGGEGLDIATHRIEIGQKALTSQIENFRSAIDRKSEDYGRTAIELFGLLLTKANSQVARKKNIIIVPDGPLWDLPFQALQETPGHPWLQDHALFQAPSLTALREIRTQRNAARSASGPTLLAFVNPQITKDLSQTIEKTRLDTKLSALPNASTQVKGLREVYGGPPASLILQGPSASEERFRKEAGQARIIYLFTHGVLINENPMRSYMVLSSAPGKSDDSDGLLEAGELMTMRLKADLVILSGCETARGHIGRGEGMIGLAWASFIAGAPTVVVSQWRIPALSTGQLMLEFHRALQRRVTAGSSMTTAQALQYASLRIRGKKGLKHPVYWAGFVIVGDGI